MIFTTEDTEDTEFFVLILSGSMAILFVIQAMKILIKNIFLCDLCVLCGEKP